MEFIDPTETKAVTEIQDGTSENLQIVDKEEDETTKLTKEFEGKVDSIYTSFESNTKQGWSNFNGFLGNLQKNLPDYVNQTTDNLNKTIEKIKQSTTNNEELIKQREELAKKANDLKNNIVNDENLKNIGEKTNEYLDSLDNELEKIENLTLSYGNKFGSLLSQTTNTASKSVWGLINSTIQIGDNNNNNNKDDENTTKKDSGFSFDLPKSFTSTRSEAQLHELQRNKEIYLNYKISDDDNDELEKLSNFKLNKEQEIESNDLINLNNDFKIMFDEIVPNNLNSDKFWFIYFDSKNKIIDQEKKRKELLSKGSTEGEDEDDEFNWDDDEDEDEDEDDETSENVETAKPSKD
ncbi:hypothetical protein B5S28_g1486 [[Candida] boidinii]|nr:hypothetical protein B5S28_g1486 [[Candida] boidinii]OWB64167.1 hypothetical protein B5S29_g5214 [[Candida] boidinii]OWB80140.1 hypothetical protein B5S32_g4393 [[Candida] boidinii]